MLSRTPHLTPPPRPIKGSSAKLAALPLLSGAATIAVLAAEAPLTAGIALCALSALLGAGLVYRKTENEAAHVPPPVATPEPHMMSTPPTFSASSMEQQKLHLERSAAISGMVDIVVEEIDRERRVLATSIHDLETHLADQPPLSGKLRPLRAVLDRGAAFRTRLLSFGNYASWQPAKIDCAELVDKAANLLRDALLSDATPLKCVRDDNLWPVEADPDQLLGALLHLAVNARDAMVRGGPISLTVQNITLDGTQAGLTGDHVAFCIADSGKGIANKHLDQIFLPFFTTKASCGGVGLSQARTVALRAHGDVSVSSTPEVGSEVVLYLPRASISKASPSGQKQEAVANLLDLLIVKPDEADATMLVQMAMAAGYRVRVASRAFDACAILREEQPRLVITDAAMPGIIENLSFARYLRRAHPHQAVVLTATVPHITMTDDFPKLPELPTRESLAAFLGEPQTTGPRKMARGGAR